MWKDSRTGNQADLPSWSLSFLMGRVELIVPDGLSVLLRASDRVLGLQTPWELPAAEVESEEEKGHLGR